MFTTSELNWQMCFHIPFCKLTLIWKILKLPQVSVKFIIIIFYFKICSSIKSSLNPMSCAVIGSFDCPWQHGRLVLSDRPDTDWFNRLLLTKKKKSQRTLCPLPRCGYPPPWSQAWGRGSSVLISVTSPLRSFQG